MSLSRKRALIGAAAATACLALTASVLGTSSGSANAAGTTSVTLFTGQVGNFTENFDPFNTTGSYLQPTLGVIYEPLFYYNKAAAGAPVPLLGTSFKWNAKGTLLTVKIRQGVTWSNGSALTANDVVFSLNLISKNAALNTSGVKWKAKKVNASTVTISFPTTAFTLEAQVLGNEPIVPQKIWSKVSNPTAVTNDHPVGSGPYMLSSFTPQSFVLKKNPHYWGTGANKPSVEQVRYISLANADAATTALESGEVDLMGGFLPTLKSIVASNKHITYSNTPQATTSLFTCSNAALGCTGPQTDPAVRQALYYAINRTQLNTQAEAGFAKPGSPTLLPNFINKAEITSSSLMTVPQKANVAKAKSILAADGWKMGSDGYYSKDGQELDLSVIVVSGWTDYDTDCTLLAGQLKAAGIKLTTDQVAQQAWTQAEVSGKYELSLDSINMGVSPNPYYTYNNYLSTAATAKVGTSATTNVSRYSNKKVDAAIKRLATTNKAAVERAAYKTIQNQIVKDMPYVPLYVNQALTEFNTSRATGWPTGPHPYAFPEPWGGNWGTGLILKRIRPVS